MVKKEQVQPFLMYQRYKIASLFKGRELGWPPHNPEKFVDQTEKFNRQVYDEFKNYGRAARKPA